MEIKERSMVPPTTENDASPLPLRDASTSCCVRGETLVFLSYLCAYLCLHPLCFYPNLCAYVCLYVSVYVCVSVYV